MKMMVPHVSRAAKRRYRNSSGAAFVVAALACFALLIPLQAHSELAPNTEDYPALAGLRFGLSVTDLDGNVLEAHRADERFMPASNAKLFVTAAALAAEAEIKALDYGLRVIETRAGDNPPTLTLVGRGDPTVGFGEDCTQRCLETLAKAVAESGITEVGDVIGDARWFADERRPLGWSWDDLKFGHGTSVSALAVNDNIIPLRVLPGGEPDQGAAAAWEANAPSYFTLSNEAKTGDAEQPLALRLERRIGERVARLYGEIPARSRSVKLDLGVDDPAYLAAWYFKHALEAEGVTVSGRLRSLRRPLQYTDEPKLREPDDPVSSLQCLSPRNAEKQAATIVASLPPAPLREITETINLESQNLYAEVLLRQLGRIEGQGSSFCGLLQIQKLFDVVGVERTAYDIADGSGLSNYNRVTPAAITALLRHAAAAPWGSAYKASLPVGGSAAGSLKRRFRGTALEGKIFAKTGTLNHADALSGYMQAKSGRMLAFSLIVNDRPLDAPSAAELIDATLLSIAARY